MNEVVRQLRAQIPWSTDPARLERLAREVEGQSSTLANTTREGGASTAQEPSSTGELPVTREQRKLAAILAADVVGYSRLMGRETPERLTCGGPLPLKVCAS